MNSSAAPTSGLPLEKISLASTLDLLDVLWRRRVLFLFCVTLGVLGGLAYYVRAKPVYESRASLLLIQRRPETITRDQRYESSFEDYVDTHRALIVSPMIINRAIETAKLGELPSFQDTEGADLRKTIIGSLEVTSGPRDLGDHADNIMTVTFQGPYAEDGPLVIEAVLNSYRTFLDETYSGISNDTLKLIGEARDLLRNDLQSNEDAYIEFRQKSPLVARGREEVNPLQDRLAAIETRRTDLLLRRAEIESQLKSIDAARAKNYDATQMTAFVASLRSQLTGSSAPTTTALDTQLYQLSDREQQLLEHFGPNHPHVVALRERLAAVRNLQAAPDMGPIDDTEQADGDPAVDIVDRYVSYLSQERNWIDTSEDLLTQLYQKEHEVAQELSSFQLKDERYRRSIDLTQTLYEGVIGQLQEASLIKDFGGFDATVIAHPELGEKVGPRSKIILALAGLLGSFLGLVAAVGAEMLDKGFRSRADIQSRLGLRVLVEIPGADSQPSPLWLRDQPGTAQSEAIRSLRAALLFNPQFSAKRLLQLTSPSRQDGTSTIAANLAISISQLGHRVLLVDADVQHPQQHQVFGLQADRGLTSLLQEDFDRNLIQETDFNGLSLLPAGAAIGLSADLFTSRRFAELLQALRDEYDYIILDTAPVLDRSDACVIAAQVDGVLLGIRPSKDSRSRAARALDSLGTTGIQPIGAVVNGVISNTWNGATNPMWVGEPLSSTMDASHESLS
ncbi:MAG: polysaccharide biosynthesis tyrosine autokinase [Planctomycetales bacterium]|nr:polysaccharide biosynthesis tyrosine autokinase [Planctomycetales bacterium]